MQRKRPNGIYAPAAVCGLLRPGKNPHRRASRMSQVHHEIVHFSGRVQGVGFRYTTRQTAQEFEVTGYVQNLPDGRVRLEAEGKKPEIDAFVGAIEERMHGLVRQVERRSAARPAQFVGFEIR